MGEGKIDFNLTIEEGISNAISYYEMAANQGNINAQIDLYEIFYVGEYVKRFLNASVLTNFSHYLLF